MKQYEQEPWNLDELFTGFDAAEVEQTITAVKEKATLFSTVREELRPDMDAGRFVNILQAYEEIVRLASRLGSYGDLRFDANTQDQQAQSYMARMQQLMAALDNQTMFFK